MKDSNYYKHLKYKDRLNVLIDNLIWSDLSIWHYFLLPFSYIFRLVVSIRRWLYKNGILTQIKFPVPIIVVGNITVGGNGKTPFVQWLSSYLLKKGYRPGIVSRGYGGNARFYPLLLSDDSKPIEVGEEAILLKEFTGCPIVVDPNRPRAIKYLLQNMDCNIVISDDGLQHYSMSRDLEFILIDNKRKLGNGCFLPAGPLREESRKTNDSVIVNTNVNELDEETFCMFVKARKLVNINSNKKVNLTSIKNKDVTLITTIANPKRIKDILQVYAKSINHIVFPDHYNFKYNDLEKYKDKLLIMTLKDAIKCKNLVGENSWYIDYTVNVSRKLQKNVLESLLAKRHK